MSTGPALRSFAAYGYDLDRRELHIQDYDVFVPADRTSIDPVRVTKVISMAATDGLGRLVLVEWSPTEFTPLDFARAYACPSATPSDVVVQPGRVVVNLRSSVTIEPTRALMLAVSYTVPIVVTDDSLHTAGALQPSDVWELQRQLGLVHISKSVRLFLYSFQREFWASFYAASAPQLGGVRIKSTCVRAHQVEHVLDLEIRDDWSRAKYFSVFAQMTADHLIQGQMSRNYELLGVDGMPELTVD